LKRFFQSEAGAAIGWVAAALVLAAAIVPWLYQAGMVLAEAAAAKDLPAILEWLGGSCGRADFGRYFSRALALSAVALLPLLFRRIRQVRALNGLAPEPWALVPWRTAVIQIGAGCLIAGGFLWAAGMTLEAFGAFTPRANSPALGKIMAKILIPAVAVPLVEEWLIRGLLLGLWLKCARPLTACVGTSLFFAFIHFLNPPDDSIIADPAAPLAGFELLGKILFHFTNPQFFITDFAVLFFIGMVLAGARVRTGALWFSIGLHAGWIVAFKGFNLLHRPVSDHSFRPWIVGENLRSGLIPLLALGLTAVVCHFVLKRFERRHEVAQPRITVTT
jgi:membrane protease YdiL (CAAX protease family)